MKKFGSSIRETAKKNIFCCPATKALPPPSPIELSGRVFSGKFFLVSGPLKKYIFCGLIILVIYRCKIMQIILSSKNTSFVSYKTLCTSSIELFSILLRDTKAGLPGTLPGCKARSCIGCASHTGYLQNISE